MNAPTTAAPRTVAVIQARMSSTRLPGKVLMPVAGRESILFMCDRVRRAGSVDMLCVATSDDPSDDPLANCLADAGIPCIRGSLNDVLARFAMAARAFDAQTVVRLTGDCPLIDPDLIDQVVQRLHVDGLDYVSNIDPPTFPDGLDAEAMTMTALETADREARRATEREHVTPFIRENPHRFRAGHVRSPVDLSGLRWTIDYSDDLEFVRTLIGKLDVDPVLADRYDFLRIVDRHGLGTGGTHARNEGLLTSAAGEPVLDDQPPGTAPRR